MAQLHAGLEALRTLPDGEERQRRELELQVALGAALFAAKGQAAGEIFRGWALARGGDVAAGTRHFQAGIAAHQATEATLLSPHYLALLAEVQLAAGRVDEAGATLASALAGRALTGECWFNAELLRRQGELLAGCDPVQAEDCLQRARFWPAASRHVSGNCGRPPRWRGSGPVAVDAAGAATSWSRSSDHLPGSRNRRTFGRHGRCSTSWHEAPHADPGGMPPVGMASPRLGSRP